MEMAVEAVVVYGVTLPHMKDTDTFTQEVALAVPTMIYMIVAGAIVEEVAAVDSYDPIRRWLSIKVCMKQI